MNPYYKEALKIVGPNDASRFSKGDKVFHWFAGRGEVVGVEGKSTVVVDWKDEASGRAKGGAWAKHLQNLEKL